MTLALGWGLFSLLHSGSHIIGKLCTIRVPDNLLRSALGDSLVSAPQHEDRAITPPAVLKHLAMSSAFGVANQEKEATWLDQS